MLSLSLLRFISRFLIIFKNTFIYIIIPLRNFLSLNISIRIILDWISCIFLSTVLLISRIIIIFRIYYIPDNEQTRFNLILIIFILSISILILRNNLFLILLGWDILGISSYILVIYYQNNSSAASGSITLLRNRLGDIFILLSISILIYLSNWEFNINESFTFLIILILIIAACTKRAQFPFSAWLPIAISAPTPISALVHSSTLVTAGVFLIIRIIENPHLITINILIILSSLTALYARISANWEQDFKKIIALSTLRQIAIIIFAVSIFSVILAFFHLIIHAFFKSLIFICAGVIIHESNYQDIRKIRLIYKSFPLISSTLGISRIALIGIPFISGFFSKDSIIEKIISSKLGCISSLIIILSIGLTATYSFRIAKLSNNPIIKNKSDSFNHSNYYANISISLIIPLSIILGSLLSWIINPIKSIFLFPNFYKHLIIFTLLIGILIGYILSYKSRTFKYVGQPAISLWFIHFLSSSLIIILSPIINTFFWIDKNWQEEYGPKKSFFITLNSSSKLEIIKTLQLITILILLLTPIILIIYLLSLN